MSVDVDYLAELFEPVGRVQFRRMFGGRGIYRDGLMFGLVTGDSIYLKVDDATRPAYEAEGCAPFSFTRKGGQAMTLSYWRLPERLLDEPDDLRAWALAAVDVSIKAAAAKARPKARVKKSG